MINITNIQNILPAGVKNTLKPFYRMVFPNQLFIVLWITFRCNYKCSYCPVVTKFNFEKIYDKNQEQDPDVWIAALDKLPQANIYLSGGEPFIYKGLPDFVNSQKKHKILGIVTNGTVPVDVYARIKRKTHLNLSYHSEFIAQQSFIDKIKKLKELKKFHLNVNIVATRENLPMIAEFKEHLVDESISLHIDPLIDVDMQFQYSMDEKATLMQYLQKDRVNTMDRLDYHAYGMKTCSAGRNYINIMPNGDVFRCAAGFEYFHSLLRKNILSSGPNAPYDPGFFSMGNIFQDQFFLDSKDIYCELPCPAACDRDMAKIKIIKE